MLGTIVILLLLLWGLGFLKIPAIPIHNISLFRVFGHTITLWEVLIFIVIMWAVETLPAPIRQIVFVLVLLWVLSTFGIIAIAGFSHLVIGAIVIGIVLALFQGR